MSLSIQWTAHTHPGKIRKNNEDSFLCLEFDTRELHILGKIGSAPLDADCDYIFAVSDGMGGPKAGEFASRIVVEKITKLLPEIYRNPNPALPTKDIPSEAALLGEVFAETHKALLFLGSSYEECEGMGATLTLCWLRKSQAYFAHIGDTRLYRYSENTLDQLTHDHTYPGWLLRNGKINERQAREHPARHSLQYALGAGHQFVEPQIGSFPLLPSDRLLLCSDGVIDSHFDSSLQDSLATPIAPDAKAFVEDSVARSGRDNTTALIIEIKNPAGVCLGTLGSLAAS